MKLKCMICGNSIEDTEPKLLFGMDGDFIHTKCSKNKEKFFNVLDRISEITITQYLNGSHSPFC